MKFKKFNFKIIKSTNDTAARIIKQTNFKFGMVVAEKQISGRGQYGKKWISYKGNLFASFFHPFDQNKFSIERATKLNCNLVKKLLSKYVKNEITFKKPNDLLINKEKISGILQEIITKSDNKFLITGIGINVIKNPNIKNYPATNLYTITGKKIKKSELENNLKLFFENQISKMYKIN
jgi:BirA family biotin operon repressor/biotin-[acetyl-CoA-carboxylase] ligase